MEYGLFEYLKNGELQNYIFTLKKKFSEEISRKIFYDIIKAVETCHESGVSHGDIKLQNIMLNNNFNIKLIDFGFAKNIKNGNDDWYRVVLDYKELDKPIPKSVIKNIMILFFFFLYLILYYQQKIFGLI